MSGSVNSCSAPIDVQEDEHDDRRAHHRQLHPEHDLATAGRRRARRPRRRSRGTDLQRGVEDDHVVAGPLPDHDDDDRGQDEVRLEKKSVFVKPSALARCVNGAELVGSRRNDHITAPTTAGTAKGMKKIVRKSRPSLATPRSNIVAKKKAIASITGIWIAPKMTTRMHARTRTRPCRRSGVVGEAGEAGPADELGRVEARVDGVAERGEHEQEEGEEEREGRNSTPSAVAPVMPGRTPPPAGFCSTAPVGSRRGTLRRAGLGRRPTTVGASWAWLLSPFR